MKVERIDGVEYEVGTEAHTHAVKQRDAKAVTAAAELSKQTARADAAEADKVKLAAEVAALSDPTRIDTAVTARASLVESARKVLGTEAKFAGLADVAIKAQVVAKVYPGIRLDEKDATRTSVLFEAAMVGFEGAASAVRADAAAHGHLRSVIAGAGAEHTGETRLDAEGAYEAMVKREQNRWKTGGYGKA